MDVVDVPDETGKLPDLGPQFFPFESCSLIRPIVSRSDRGGPIVSIGSFRRWRIRRRVGIQDDTRQPIERSAVHGRTRLAAFSDRLISSIRPAFRSARIERSFPFSIRSEAQTSELPSLMRISHAVFCLRKKRCRYRHNTATKSTP